MFEHMTFEKIMDRMLSKVPRNMDKREGSVIWDALSPSAVELSQMYISLDEAIEESFADTSSRDYLIKRAKEHGIIPFPATNAILEGAFTPADVEVPLGSRFTFDKYIYTVTKKVDDGKYWLMSETKGIVGNQNMGKIIPVEYISGLYTANLVEVLIPGNDEEETETFRQRYFDSFHSLAYGGNIADYKEKVMGMQGVGGVKVTPHWQGGGTVKLTIIDSEWEKPTQELIEKVQTEIDPMVNSGLGYGVAPIGHVVTVVPIENKVINMEAHFTFHNPFDFESSLLSMQKAIDNLLLELTKSWHTSKYPIVIRISAIENALYDCEEVLDIENLTINNSKNNIVLGDEEIPLRGEIVNV